MDFHRFPISVPFAALQGSIELNRKVKYCSACLTVLCMLLFAVCQWAFAQEVSPLSAIKDPSQDEAFQGLTITARDGSASALAGTVATDEPGNDSPTVRFMKDYIYLAKPGYDSMSTLNVDTQLSYRPNQSKRVLSWETGEGKSYLIPALEIPAFILALNGASRLIYPNSRENGKRVYGTNFSTIWDNLEDFDWHYDKDAFHVNQFGHPYQGSIYHGFARSAGLNFWESLGYTFLGSFLWEIAGETTKPSVNDQVASGIAGSFLGEILFRMASLLLESGGGNPGFWRELGAAALSPPTGLNRLVFGDRFKAVFPSRDPAVFQWARLGEGVIVSNRTGENVTHRNQESLTYSMDYGLPGKPDYNYTRPFDYFRVEVGAISRAHVIENITTRGLLLGKKYEAGDSYRGIWGLYGSFDYVAPRFFRVSSTAASLGTTFQWWLSPKVALQSTVLGGVGLGAAGKAPSELNRDYHFGITGRGLLALRLIFGEVAMLNLTNRGYYVSSLGGSKPKGTETINHLEAGLFFRIYGHHGLGIQYTTLYRSARYSPSRNNVHQTQGTLSFVYTLLSDTRFGAVEWRKGYTR